MKVRLENEVGKFVIAGDILPPYSILPTVILWDKRIFTLYEAGSTDQGYPSRYRERFSEHLIETTNVDPLPPRKEEERLSLKNGA